MPANPESLDQLVAMLPNITGREDVRELDQTLGLNQTNYKKAVRISYELYDPNPHNTAGRKFVKALDEKRKGVLRVVLEHNLASKLKQAEINAQGGVDGTANTGFMGLEFACNIEIRTMLKVLGSRLDYFWFDDSNGMLAYAAEKKHDLLSNRTFTEMDAVWKTPGFYGYAVRHPITSGIMSIRQMYEDLFNDIITARQFDDKNDSLAPVHAFKAYLTRFYGLNGEQMSTEYAGRWVDDMQDLAVAFRHISRKKMKESESTVSELKSKFPDLLPYWSSSNVLFRDSQASTSLMGYILQKSATDEELLKNLGGLYFMFVEHFFADPTPETLPLIHALDLISSAILSGNPRQEIKEGMQDCEVILSGMGKLANARPRDELKEVYDDFFKIAEEDGLGIWATRQAKLYQ